jgi:hypothetical protein
MWISLIELGRMKLRRDEEKTEKRQSITSVSVAPLLSGPWGHSG